MSLLEKHFVTFLSPGTLFHEMTTREIDSWNVEKAKEQASTITERYNAKPFGFYFTTRTRGDDDFDSRETARSGIYYLGGTIKTLADIEAENDPYNKILISNMQINNIERVIVNTNSYKVTQEFRPQDVILDMEM